MKTRTTVVALAVATLALWPAPASAHIDKLVNQSFNASADPLEVTVGLICDKGDRALVRSGVSEEFPGPSPSGPKTQSTALHYRGAGYAKAACTGALQFITVEMTKEVGVFTTQVCPPADVTWESTATTKVGGSVHDKARTSTSFTVSNC